MKILAALVMSVLFHLVGLVYFTANDRDQYRKIYGLWYAMMILVLVGITGALI